MDWALDEARDLEERYTLELIIELGVGRWYAQRKIARRFDLQATMEKKRQRFMNPAYEPKFTREDLERTAEVLPLFTSWHFSQGLDDRPVRDLKAFGFLTELQELQLSCDASDCRVFATLPKLRVLNFTSEKCEDFSPLAECRHLRQLGLSLGLSWTGTGTHWPKVAGLEKLTELEVLNLTGNLLAFAPGITWPKVRVATLSCSPLAVRSVRDLPQVPACEILSLMGVERLEGIEAYARLRNFKLGGNVRSFEPLTALKHLTWFQCSGFEPLDVRPLTRLPQLQCVIFNADYRYNLQAPKPRDFSPFTEAPLLRELHVYNCPPVEAEVKTLNSFLLPWDDVLLASEPRPVPSPLRMIVAPISKVPRHSDLQLSPEDDGLADDGLRTAEGIWTGKLLFKAVSAALGCEDWGEAEANGTSRAFMVTINAYAVVEKLPLIVEAVRSAIARLRHEYTGNIMIRLTAPVPEPTPAQVELQKQFDEERERAEFEQRQRERMELLDRQHRYDLKKQLGDEIKPEEFTVPPPAPLPEPPWEQDEDDGEDDEGEGGIAVKEKVEPPPDPWDNEHPLADKYRLLATLTLSELWILPHHKDIACYLMQRQPDREITEDIKAD